MNNSNDNDRSDAPILNSGTQNGAGPPSSTDVPGTPAPEHHNGGTSKPPSAPSARRAAESVVAAVSQPSTPFVAGTPTDGPQGAAIPSTPASRRRELGTSQVRLTTAVSTPVANTPRTPGTPTVDGDDHKMVLWGTSINYDDTHERLTKFTESFRAVHDDPKPTYIQELQRLADTGDAFLDIDMLHLYRFDSALYRTIVCFPSEVITIFDAVVHALFEKHHPDEVLAITERRRSSITVRPWNLRSADHQSMRTLNPSDISSMVAVRGMVIRASPLIPDIQRAMYRCNKCFRMQEQGIQDGRISEPRVCPACRARDSFTLLHSRSSFTDKQMVRLQEAPEAVPKGDTPATFTLVTYDSLVDSTKPGDRVEITGILRATPVRLNPRMRTVRSVFRTYIDCVHVRVLNNKQARATAEGDSMEDNGYTSEIGNTGLDEEFTFEKLKARNKRFETLSQHPQLYEILSSSLAPSIFGMTDEKKGVLLQLFGGASKDGTGQANSAPTADGSARFRSAINVLLVGDPGTSKSQLLQCAHRLAPRGVYTSGRGSSAVGLTAYVTRDPDSDEFVLESGALVLSDQGVCCIDEFDKMSDFARSVLHEAMEQQTVSIAKAGIIATLNARTAVLAAANPVHSRYDTSKSVVDNIDLPPTLLSRFDLIYLVLDAPNADADRRLARHIVSLFYKNYDNREKVKRSYSGKTETADCDEELNPIPLAPDYSGADLLKTSDLTGYIAYAREKVDPKLCDDAAKALVDGYLEMRGGGRGGSNITATPRQLESLIRLAEAHARMKLSEIVTEADVEEAMRLVKAAMHMAAFDPNTGKIDMNLFAMGQSRAAQMKVDTLAKVVLEKLNDLMKGSKVEVSTVELLAGLRKDSDVDIVPADVREALRRLDVDEKISLTKGGTHVRLVDRNLPN